MIIGIDFGTCYSHVTIDNNGLLQDDVVQAKGHSDIPTLYLKVNGKEYFGPDCLNNKKIARDHPDEIVREMKKIIREDADNLKKQVGKGSDAQTLEDVVKKYIKYLLEVTDKSLKENGMDQSIDYIAITAPSGLTNSGIQSTDYNKLLKNTIIEITGLDENRVFVKEEPVAAAFSYIDENNTKDQTIFVFDLGGGTVDVSIVRYEQDSEEIEVIATDGDYFGGNKWSEELHKLVLTDMLNKGLDPKNFSYVSYFDKIDALKKELSSMEAASVSVRGNSDEDEDVEICITRERFELQTESLLNSCMDVVNRIFKSSRDKGIKNFDDIDHLVLVGGGSNMPQIKKRFLKQMGLDPSKIELYKPTVAISHGAAYYARVLGEQSDIGVLGDTIKEIANHTYGIEVYENDVSDVKMIKNLIFKGQPYIGSRLYEKLDKTLQPYNDNCRNFMYIKIYESDASKKECQNGFMKIRNKNQNLIRTLKIPIPEGYRETPTEYKIEVEFILSADCILTVIGKDPKNNKSVFTAEIEV